MVARFVRVARDTANRVEIIDSAIAPSERPELRREIRAVLMTTQGRRN